MSSYFLFFPVKGKDVLKKDAAHFEGAGFDPAWCDIFQAGNVIGKSPSGGKGVVYTPRGTAGYFPDRQHWEKRDGYWLGWSVDKQGRPIPPTPAGCLRHENHGGVPVKLADGQEWLVPIAQQLPHAHTYDAKSGQWQRLVKDPFREYWDETLKFYMAWVASFTGEEPGSVESTWGQAANFATLAIGLNYYLTPGLMSEFGLFDDAALQRVQEAAMEAAAILTVAAQKKTEPATTRATSSSASGRKS